MNIMLNKYIKHKDTFIVLLLITTTLLVFLWKNDIFNFEKSYYLLDNDQSRTALVAKNIAEGNGYTTQLLPLAMIDFYHTNNKLDAQNWENADRFPLTALLIAGLYKLLGTTDYYVGIVVYGIIFFILSALLLYKFSLSITKNYYAAILSVTLMLYYPDIIHTSFFKGADDIFLVLFSVYFYVTNREKILTGNVIDCILLGFLFSLLFLLRMNIGLFFVLAVIVDVIIINKLKNGSILSNYTLIKTSFISFGLLALLITPFGLYTYYVWGKPFFISNALYQFSHHTEYQMFTNPWWKLNTPIGQYTNIELFFNDPLPFIRKYVDFIYNNIRYLTLAYFGAFFFAGYSLFYTIKNADYSYISLLIIAIVLIFLNLLSLGFFTGGEVSVWYYIFFLPLLFIFSGHGITIFWNKLISSIKILIEKLTNLKVRFTLNDVINILILFIILFYLTGRFGFQTLNLSSVSNPTLVNIINAVFLTSILFFISLLFSYFLILGRKTEKQRKMIFLLFLLLIIISMQIPIVGLKNHNVLASPSSKESLQLLKDSTTKDGIALTFNGFMSLPWLTGKKTLTVPEYPAHVYSLIKDYSLDIDSIYLDGVIPWLNESEARTWAPSYAAYGRIAKYALPYPGFKLIKHKKELKGYRKYGISTREKHIAIYKRTNDNISDIFQSPNSFDFSNLNNAIHLVSGFDVNAKFDGKDVVIGTDNVKQHFSGQKFGPYTDHDITFFVDHKKPKEIQGSFYVTKSMQVAIYLNLDLDIYDKPELRLKRKVFDDFLNKGWHTVSFSLPHQLLVNGVNKLGVKVTDFNKILVANNTTIIKLLHQNGNADTSTIDTWLTSNYVDNFKVINSSLLFEKLQFLYP